MLPTQERLRRSWLLPFATVATEFENRLSDFLLILLDFGFYCFFLYWLQRGKKKSSGFSSGGALHMPFPSLISFSLSYYLLDISQWPTYTSWGSTSLEWNFHLCQVRKEGFFFGLVYRFMVCRLIEKVGPWGHLKQSMFYNWREKEVKWSSQEWHSQLGAKSEI